MKREWQPGDVAMVHIARWPAAREWSDDTSAVLVRVAEDGYMHVVDGDPAAPLCVPPRLIAEYVRPLSDCQSPWSYANNCSDAEYAAITAVRILSEGVTP